MLYVIKIIILMVLAVTMTAPEAFSGPVRNNSTVYRQPDGTTFHAMTKGDEWTKIRTTADGCAIVKNEEGWWCYGSYSHDGTLVCSDFIVGREAPGDILAASRNIPYSVLAEKAAMRKAENREKNASVLESVRRANSARTKAGAAATQKRGIAILAQFQDVRFTYTKEDFIRMLNEPGYNGTGSAKDYYEDQFGEGWEFTFDVSDIITLPNPVKYYGQNGADDTDIRPATMVWEACRLADSQIDFSIYDQDGDGEVDNVYVFYAGYDESEYNDQPDLLWAHQYYVRKGSENVPGVEKLDGVWIDRYACSAEMNGKKNMTGIGVFCHEYGHTFGLPDFYDTDYDTDGKTAAGLWNKTSLMDGGCYNNNSATPPNFNCIERKLLGLSEEVEITVGNHYTLAPVDSDGKYGIITTATKGEYFLFECRSNNGWDEYIGGKGMLAYHIDENAKDMANISSVWTRWDYNTVNADPYHQCADLIEADMRSDVLSSDYIISPYSNIKGIFYPQPDATAISPALVPSFKLWNGLFPETSVAGIELHDDGSVSFSAVTSDAPVIPEVADFYYQAYPDAIFISFKASSSQNNERALLEWNISDGPVPQQIELKPSSTGRYACLIPNLASGNVLYKISAKIYYGKLPGNTFGTSVMTKRQPPVKWPYLYMQDGERISRERGFVTHIVNTSYAAKTEWFLDGKPAVIENGCIIYPRKDGTISCVVTWKDGSSDTIVKTFTLTD